MWKADIERESWVHSSLGHRALSLHLRNYLRRKYSYVNWAVIVYDGTCNCDGALHGLAGEYYCLFHHYGHNIAVGRLVFQSHSACDNLESLFWQAYSPVTISESSGFWGWSRTTRLNTGQTVTNTWNRLVQLGVSPIMLNIIRKVPYTASWYFNNHLIHVTLRDGYGYATLIAH